MSHYTSAIEDSAGIIHATLSIIHIDPACGKKLYIGTGREVHQVNCPDCLVILNQQAPTGTDKEAHTA